MVPGIAIYGWSEEEENNKRKFAKYDGFYFTILLQTLSQ